MIYFDNASTTKILDKTKKKYIKYLDEFYNASSPYSKGIEQKRAINKSRNVISNALGCEGSELFFAASATEFNNIIIKGTLRSSKKDEYIFSSGEHSSIYEISRQILSMGYTVHYIGLNKDGSVNLDELKEKVNNNTRLVSIIHCSNETGNVNDIKKASEIIKSINPKTIFHSDGVQAFLKINVNVKFLGVDAYTISGHKCYSPKGVAAAYINNKVKLTSLIAGGGQEFGIRSGTENTAAIAAFAKTVEELYDKIELNKKRVLFLNKKLCTLIRSGIDDIVINTDIENPYIINLIIKGVKSEVLINMLDEKNIYVGSGSSCSNNGNSINRVLDSAGYSKVDQKNSIRISLGIYNTEEEVIEFTKVLKNMVERIRNLL